MTQVGVLKYPGASAAADLAYVLPRVLDVDVVQIDHEEEGWQKIDLLILPGGAAFCDLLRPGALARSSASAAGIRRFARRSPVLGIGNGFQILCELGILPGALLINSDLHFANSVVHIGVEKTNCLLTKGLEPGRVLRFPVACLYGRYYADQRTMASLEEKQQIVFRYSSPAGDPINDPVIGSSVCGISNAEGNVLGVMFHPERVCEEILGGTDGAGFFRAILNNLAVSSTANSEEEE